MMFLLSSFILFSCFSFSAGAESTQNTEIKEFFLEKPSTQINKRPTQNTGLEEQNLDQQDFKPSLSETLSDTNRLKKQIKKQVADNITNTQQSGNPEESGTKQALSRKTAHFGELEVSISERTKEDILKAPKKKKAKKKRFKKKK